MNPLETSSASVTATAKHVIASLAERKCMLGVSESVTGGMIASYLARVDGCSKVLFASQVLYSIAGKASFCNVPASLIVEKGTVSEFIIHEMLDCMARRFFTIIADPGLASIACAPSFFVSLATCGVAGESIEGLPRGTVLAGISVYSISDCRCIDNTVHRWQFDGDRAGIMIAATSSALSLVLEKERAGFLGRG
jgi:nicotinamide-nucleotide amidase